jgi:hypothetical protein
MFYEFCITRGRVACNVAFCPPGRQQTLKSVVRLHRAVWSASTVLQRS